MYKEKLDGIMYEVNNKSISTKILQHMDKIRNNDDEGQARRFVWELIQNAKDVARDDVPLRIRMTMDDQKLVFAHNGKNFRLKNLLSLINQVSGKTGEGTTGKFGTGFITTHLLSERVTVRGILEDSDEEAKPFEVILDRSGKTNEEITESVNRSMDMVRNVDDNETVNIDPGALNTEFEYHLNTEYSRNIARTGMNDACCNIFYCMSFVPQLYEIELVDLTNDTKIIYKRRSSEKVNDVLTKYMISENEAEHSVILVSDGEVDLAAELDSENRVVPMNEKSSRLFCDFPLIDNVCFPFPTAVNSTLFKVNEPRSCITLTDNPNSTDSEINKKLMKQAVALYAKMLDYIEQNNCDKVYYLVETPPVFSRSDLSSDWITENIIKGISKAAASHEILPGIDGKFAASEKKLAIPSLEYPEIIVEVNYLIGELGYHSITENIVEWGTALQSVGGYDFKFIGIKELLSFADKTGTVSALSKQLTAGSVYDWLRRLYLCAVKIDTLKNEIYVGTYKIIPTQSGDLLGINNVYAETQKIDEYFKEICDKIDTYTSAPNPKLLLRKILIAEELDTTGYEKINAFDMNLLVSHLKFGTRSTQTAIAALDVKKKMGACCPDDRAFEIYHTLIDKFPERYIPKLKLGSDVWMNTYISLDYKLRDSFLYYRKYYSADKLFTVFGNKDKAVDAINFYYEMKDKFSIDSLIEGPILDEDPDGNIELQMAGQSSSFYVTNGGVDDLMKKIYYKTVSNGARIILKEIKLSVSMRINSLTEFNAASLISNRITAALKNGALYNQPKEFQNGCSLLMRWINSNEKRAEELFPAFASKENRMLLLTPGQAAEISEQLDSFNDLLKSKNIKNIEDLRELLDKAEASEPEKNEDPDHEITPEYYSFGYSDEMDNYEEVTKAIGDAGEQLAEDILKKKYGPGAVVTLRNDEFYKQQGYDIHVRLADGSELFYEVKTHTQTSKYRNHLSFSRSQARMLPKKNYRVLLVIIDKFKQLVESAEFDDIFEAFSWGNFIRDDGIIIETK